MRVTSVSSHKALLWFKQKAKIMIFMAVISGAAGLYPVDTVHAATYGVVNDIKLAHCINFALGRATPYEQSISAANMGSLSGVNLACASKGITDISGLEYLPATITSLNISNNTISDLSPLITKTGIKMLNVSYNPTLSQTQADTNLSQMTWLKSLDIGNTLITNMNFLSGYTSLETLYVNGYTYAGSNGSYAPANSYNFAALSSLTTLKDLALLNAGITDVSFISTLTNIKTLALSYNYITNVTPIANLTSLNDLRIIGNYVLDMSPIGSLPIATFYGYWNSPQGADIYVPSGATSYKYIHPATDLPTSRTGVHAPWLTTSPVGDVYTLPGGTTGNEVDWYNLAAGDADTYLTEGFSEGASATTGPVFGGYIWHTVIRVAVTTDATLPDAIVGQSYSQQLATTQPSSTFTHWSIVSGSLPSGLSLSATGAITGTPTSATTATFTTQVTDDFGNIMTKSFTVTTAIQPVVTTVNQVYVGSDITGTATPGSSVTIYDGKTIVCTATANSNGTFTCTPSAPVATGTSLTAVATLGSLTSSGVASVVKGPVWMELSITSVSEGSHDATVTGHGFLPGESVTATVHSTPVILGTKTTDTNGDVTFTFNTSGLATGKHSVELTGEQSGTAIYKYSANTSAVYLDFDITSAPVASGLATTGQNVLPFVAVALSLIALPIFITTRRKTQR